MTRWTRFKCWLFGCDARWFKRPQAEIDAEWRERDALERSVGYFGKGKPPALPPMPQVVEMRCARCGRLA